MATVSVNHLSFAYTAEDETPKATLTDLSMTFKNGAFTLLTGPSGSGKSTLLKLIAGLYPAFSGKVTHGTLTLNDQPLSAITPTKRSQLVAMMFQNPNQQFAMDTVENELIFALENQQLAPSDIPPRIDKALDFLEITALRDRVLSTLSGGEKQKVALAVIVAMDSDTILLDEPFASVDPEARQLLLGKLSQLQREQHKTIILADHDLEDYGRYIDQLIVMNADGTALTRLSDAEKDQRLADFSRSKTDQVTFALPTQTEDPAIQLSGLKLTAGTRTLLDQDQFTFYQNRITLLTGPNGVGKSTLLDAMAKLHPYAGSIQVKNQEVHKWAKRKFYHHLGIVFQDAEEQFLNVTMAEELALSTKNSQQAAYFKDRLPAMLRQLRLDGMAEHVVYSLSGGQKKKLQILEMLMMGTPILLFDEPFTGLDFRSMQQVIVLMKQVAHDCHQTYIIVSHQLYGIADLIDYHVQLRDQQLTYEESLS
ncbi:ABC transporter ATP-binding protein [Secundilactobacillus paracollinoides]|uniref:ABC transporter ATP-binding protein n=1 Tax=Secundilactobacillus paracollinoides TaxID=240427 RepID=UPI0006D1E37A|nr:ABC transporter ATP-binding protein [Secundilactobacillus paracollinoides]